MKRVIELNRVRLRGRTVLAAGKIQVEVPKISAITFATNHSVIFVENKPIQVRELADEIRAKMFGLNMFSGTA